MNLRTRLSVAAIAAVVVAAGAFPTLSGASPVDDKRRQAAELQRQIDANDHEIVTLSEQLNGARYRVAQAEAAIAEAEQRANAAEAQRRHIRDILGQRAAQIYRGAGSSTPLTQMDVSSVTEFATRKKYASSAADRDNQLIAKLRKVQEELDNRRADLERQQATAKSEAEAADQARNRIQSANSQKQALKNQITGQIASLLAQEQASRDAAIRAAAAAGPPRTRSTSRAIPTNFPNVPAPNAGAAAAVAFAKAQVGKGYRYATSGPDTFDCSGLTAAAWARGGVSLAHYSGAQYQETTRIGAGDLQPGDLVFYGPGGSQHVEIYIGGGMVVSASNPSSGVKLAGVRYGSASGYGRVHA
ncbi:MAG: NlpC/P60 family protein [Acidimicrobiia bacterium]